MHEFNVAKFKIGKIGVKVFDGDSFSERGFFGIQIFNGRGELELEKDFSNESSDPRAA